MPCASIAAWCSGLARTARSPPWTPGWSVLTRPSIISGKPVRSDTSSTGKAGLGERASACRRSRRGRRRARRARARRARRPVLSDTERSARVTRFRSLGIAAPEAGKGRDITKAAPAKRDTSPRDAGRGRGGAERVRGSRRRSANVDSPSPSPPGTSPGGLLRGLQRALSPRRGRGGWCCLRNRWRGPSPPSRRSGSARGRRGRCAP